MTGPPNDPYAVLGVGHDASQAQISSAYRAGLRRHHPDTRDAGADAAAADTALAQTIAAYLVLADPGTRAEHDRRHEAAPRAPEGDGALGQRQHAQGAEGLGEGLGAALQHDHVAGAEAHRAEALVMRWPARDTASRLTWWRSRSAPAPTATAPPRAASPTSCSTSRPAAPRRSLPRRGTGASCASDAPLAWQGGGVREAAR